MAKTDCNLRQAESGKSDEQRPSLKYMDFVVIATLQALMLTAKLYAFAKERSGPIKPGINFVEDSVRSVLGPLYLKFNHIPIQLLIVVDRKFDKSVNRVQNLLPPYLKSASFKAFKHARQAPVAARSVMVDVKNEGMVETTSKLAKIVIAKYEPVAKDLYTKYEPLTEEYALYAWRVLNQYLLFQRATQAAALVACYCSEMYNQKVQNATQSGYKVAAHLPLIPIEKIAEALRNEKMKPLVINGGHEQEVAA